MFNWKAFERTKVILSQVSTYQEFAGQHHVTIRPTDLKRWIELVSEDLGFLILVDIAGVDLSEIPNSRYRFELTYHLMNMDSHQRLNMHVHFEKSEIVPSITTSFSHASWLEREQREALGIRFDSEHEGLLLPKPQTNYPLRRGVPSSNWPVDEEEKIPQLRINPNKSETPYPEESYEWKRYTTFSMMTAGMFEWLVCYDPVKVVGSKISVGYHHQALEKMLEGRDWQQVLHLVDRIHLGAAPTYSTAWAKNLEDLLRIKLPERAQAIRIVVLELSRIAEHLTVMHDVCFALKLEEHRLFINLREKIYELLEKYCGRRQGLGIIRVGGVREDLPHGWIVEYQSVCDLTLKTIRTIHRSLMTQSKFRETLSGANVSAQTALEWGVSGPAMRAAGLNFDLRKSQPFYFYQDIDFDIPVGINGSAYERYLIRYEEIFQSFRIITQVIDNLPLGEFLNPDYDKDYVGVQEAIHALEIPKNWQFTSLESPNGEAGFLVLYNRSSSPYRVKIKTPSFSLAQALPHFMLGIREDQLRASLASLGIRSFELDR